LRRFRHWHSRRKQARSNSMDKRCFRIVYHESISCDDWRRKERANGVMESHSYYFTYIDCFIQVSCEEETHSQRRCGRDTEGRNTENVGKKPRAPETQIETDWRIPIKFGLERYFGACGYLVWSVQGPSVRARASISCHYWTGLELVFVLFW
jgi:hypothetical protein